MDFIVVIIVLVIGFIVISGLFRLAKINSIADDLEKLRKENALHRQSVEQRLDELKKIVEGSARQQQKPTEPPPAPKPVEILKPVEETITPPITETPPTPKPEPILLSLAVPEPEKVRPVGPPVYFEKPVAEKHKSETDFERFIGENLAGKIGIAILVLGIGFFVKYAIDRDMINEWGRVAIGLLCGGLLLGIAHRLRGKYRAFSSVLAAGGISTFYFTIAIAFRLYALMDQSTAFVIMVLITGLSVALSLWYNRVELAAISLIGGFASPFIVSTGEGNYTVLFSYLLILNAGMLALAYFRKWDIINIMAFAFTVLIYAGWLALDGTGHTEKLPRGLMFGAGFYLLFFLMNVVKQVKEGLPFGAFQTIILLANTTLFYGAGMFMLERMGSADMRGIFTAGMAVFNLPFAIYFYYNSKIDRNLVLWLAGLVIVFVSLIAPVELYGSYITLFWAAESVALLWFSQRSKISLAQSASLVLTLLTATNMISGWSDGYQYSVADYPATLANKYFITGLFVFAAFFISKYLLRREVPDYDFYFFKLPAKNIQLLLTFFCIITAYFTLFSELNYNLDWRLHTVMESVLVKGLYNFLFVLALLLIYRHLQSEILRGVLTALVLVAAALYVFYYNPYNFIYVKDLYTSPHRSLFGLAVHYLSTATLLVILVQYFRMNRSTFAANAKVTVQLLCHTAAIYILSSELLLHAALLNINDGIETYTGHIKQAIKSGLPVLWGIYSFVLMWQGLSRKNRGLRIFSLSLIALTLLKLFIYDIRGVSEGGKIIAFIILGILLLVISFMYQKIRYIIFRNEGETATEDADNRV